MSRIELVHRDGLSPSTEMRSCKSATEQMKANISRTYAGSYDSKVFAVARQTCAFNMVTKKTFNSLFACLYLFNMMQYQGTGSQSGTEPLQACSVRLPEAKGHGKPHRRGQATPNRHSRISTT